MSEQFDKPMAVNGGKLTSFALIAGPKPGRQPVGTETNVPHLTHFHSFFNDTFTWKYPRTTGLLFASSLLVIFLGHFVDLLRYVFKGAYITFAVVAFVEYVGRPVTGTGFMTQLRPRHYYVIPRENLEVIFVETHDFLNFLVLEFQRVLFVESLPLTLASFVLSFIGYFMIKLLPLWSLVLIADIGLFTLPLVYLQNQELIDTQIKRISAILNQHVQNAKGIAGKHTATYMNKARSYSNDIGGKLSNYQNRQKIPPGAKGAEPVPQPNETVVG